MTFASNSFDLICTSDVLEHVSQYRAALEECARCLRPGGHLVLSVPFALHEHNTLVRAQMCADGSIKHHTEPEYHGNPLDNTGLLCFYHFGWDLLDDMRAAGFVDARVRVYWSFKLGYLGGPQILITARKPAQS